MPTDAVLQSAVLPPPDDARRVGELLRTHSIHEVGLLRVLGAREMSEASALDMPSRLARTEGDAPAHTLIRLFFFGIPVKSELLARAIAPMTLEQWAAWGLVQISGDTSRALVQLYPDGEQVFATDMPQFENGRMVVPEACVMTPGTTTKAVKNLAIRRPVESALDIGTGCGILGIFAAAYARRAVATDLTQRSVDFARFNAIINNVHNFESVRGSLLEPVRDRKFDAILANPPFVISPSNRYIYRDGGMHGDMFIQSLITQAAGVLNPGGTCQFLCDWAHVHGQNPVQRVASWFANLGCDVLIMRVSGMSTTDYARFWTRQLEDNAGPEALQQSINEWLTYYRQQGIEAMSHGHISMRKLPAGAARKPAIIFQEQKPTASGNISEQLRRILWNVDLAALDDAALAARVLVPAPELRLRQDVTPPGAAGSTGTPAAEFAVLLRSGLGTTLPSSAEVGRMLLGLAPGKPLSRVIEELAAGSGRPPAQLVGPVLAAIRKLLEHGMLTES